jgi:hypothetical protein
MSNDQIDELYGKGSLGKIKQYHKDASAVSTDSHIAKSYHDTSVGRTETLGRREKAKADIAKAKKGSTREKGWRNYLGAKDDSATFRKSSQYSRSSMSADDKRIHGKYLKARGVQEDAPTVNAGSGNIAGIGVGAKGEPGVSPRHQPKKNKSVANSIVASMMRRRSPVMEQEQIDELSRKTLSNYIKKASDNRAKSQGEFDFYYKKKNSKKYGKAFRNVLNRRKGIRTATDKLVKEETFAGAAIFEVSSKLFHNITLQKRKGKHWRTYLEEDDCYAEIREWARKHPKGKIVVRNESTGEMRYVRY